MMQWDENEQDYIPIDWKQAFRPTQFELDGVYERLVRKFDEACERLEREEDDAKIMHLLRSTLGLTTYMVEK